MGISDMITDFIYKAIQDSGGVFELQRSSLAEMFGCVPSQINYVIATRFSPEHGYIVESRRGGGGFIRISRAQLDKAGLLMHTINSIGLDLDAASALALLKNLYADEIISECSFRLIAAATGEQSLRKAPPNIKNRLRAEIFKQTLINLI